MILRALFFDNSEEFGKNVILGQPPRFSFHPYVLS